MRKFLALLCCSTSLAACDLSPDYSLPSFDLGTQFKEENAAPDAAANAAPIEPVTDGKWKRFDEKAQIEEIAWWRMFGDEALNTLMEDAMRENPSLEQAAQRVIQARAVADSAGASLLPSVGLGAGPTRQLQSPASIEPNMPAGTTINTKPYTLYSAQGTISYELDLFGKNRNNTRAAEEDANAQSNTYRAARQSLQADVAQTYFQLRALQEESRLLARTIATREEALSLTRQKRDVGMIDDVTFGSSETDLANVKASAAAVAQQQAVAEHALAILVGKPPVALSVAHGALPASVPAIPGGLPSSLLERRPDVKAAEKSIAAANARIGVAKAGYFPDITLSASGGFTSGELNDLFNWSSRTWALGPLAGTVLTQPIFEGGRIAAVTAQRDAAYAESVAAYRGAVLQAFREVEDQLSNQKNLADQYAANRTALASATRTYDIAKQRYSVGYSSYLEQLDAERNQLAAQRTDVQLRGNRLIATVQLLKALGGSWEGTAVSLPNAPAPELMKPAAATPESTGTLPFAKQAH